MAQIRPLFNKEGPMLRAITRYAAVVVSGASVALIAIAVARESAGPVRTLVEAATSEPELPPLFSPPASKGPAITWDISNLAHARVEYWIVRFQTDMRDDFGRFLER